MKPFDVTKLTPDENGHMWAQTIGGEKVRILCIDGPHTAYPVIGILCVHGVVDEWTLSGQSRSLRADIINRPDVADRTSDGWP